VVGHWGTTPGQNFIYVHLNRVINKYDLNMFYIAGPVTAARPLWATSTSRHLERDLSERHPRRSRAEKAVHAVLVSRRDFQSCGADNAGSIHEGGELGYSLSHAFGAAFDNPI